MRTIHELCLCLVGEERKERNRNLRKQHNNKQEITIKYFGIIFDSKLIFRDRINYIKERCLKLIFSLSRSAK